jgi:hypothetical protein
MERFVVGVPPPPSTDEVIWPKFVADGLELLGAASCE